MDKDLASAIMLERCSCYDRSLEAAKRVLANKAPETDDAFWARKIIRSLGEEFIRQRFMDKAMECYQALTEYRPDPKDCPEVAQNDVFEGLGPNSIEVKTQVSNDVHELLEAILASECSASRNQDDLLREALYLLILKYATQKDVREKLANTLAKAIQKD
jgi:SOS response regulatory protein OraA/RecX